MGQHENLLGSTFPGLAYLSNVDSRLLMTEPAETMVMVVGGTWSTRYPRTPNEPRRVHALTDPATGLGLHWMQVIKLPDLEPTSTEDYPF